MLAISAVARAADLTFLIESIKVEGIRFSSPAIVRAESKLVEGRAYSEAQIRDAVARVHRLPFVVDADVRLEKGSERGKYVLVLRIEEMKPLFLNYRSLHERLSKLEKDRFHTDPRTGERVHGTNFFTLKQDFPNVGGRVFLGSRSMVAASAELSGGDPCCDGDNQYSLAFTQYDIGGTRASLGIVAQYTEYTFDYRPYVNMLEGGGRLTSSFGDHFSWGVTGVLPLFGNNALTASWHWQQRQEIVNPGGHDEIVRVTLNQPHAAWVYDSTNDLLFPTSGTYGSLGMDLARVARLQLETPGFLQNVISEYHWGHSYNGVLTHYFELTPHQSVSAGLTGLRVPDTDYKSGGVNAGYSASLWNSRAGGYSDLRFQIGVGRFWDNTHSSSGRLLAGLAFRNAWGVARFDFQYFGWRHPD